jgi:hypothetical protein
VIRRSGWIAAVIALLVGCHQPATLPTPQEAIASKADLWGDAALRQPGGPSYAFFERLLPPLRYVDADFRHYPIVLSAPNAPQKGRLISNGSGINLLARQPNWKNEAGTPVHVLVGDRRETFGQDLARLEGPHYAEGYLPIVQLRYTCDGDVYGEEAFADANADISCAGDIRVKFKFPAADRGRLELRFETGSEFCSADGGEVVDPAGRVLARFDDNWEFNPFRSALTSKQRHAAEAVVCIYTNPPSRALKVPGGAANEEEAAGTTQPVAGGPRPFELEVHNRRRAATIEKWNDLLARGMQVDAPEDVVNRAWRSLLVGTHMIRAADQLNYSASNQYARQYANECGDSMRSLLLWGHTDAARAAIEPLLVYRRPASVIHDAAFKLELLADYFFQAGDRTLIERLRPLWQQEIDLLLKSRGPDGLLAKERYCSDIDTPVSSLNNNANAWRGLRDMSLVLADCGHAEQAEKLAKIAADYRPQVLAAMEAATFRTVDPPFIPVALGGEEKPPLPITSTRLGSYWNLVIPCVLWSGLFPIDSPPADAIIQYIQRNGGLCMGMTRVQSNRGVWFDVQNIDDLYGLRYQLALLKRDEPDRALVGFYGKLAQGMTRDTFIDGESSGIVPLDSFGRQLALPPNSAANASFLIQLRNLLVQDWDMNDDGRADTLRLAFATPRAWLEDGKRIDVTNAPTAFGVVSFTVDSHLADGRVDATVTLPPRPPRDVRLRLRVPDGWRITGATSSGRALPVRGETIDLSDARERTFQVSATVRRVRR